MGKGEQEQGEGDERNRMHDWPLLQPVFSIEYYCHLWPAGKKV